jgi:hypothetical protein
VLTERQARLYARQVILAELGPAGQARLCASEAKATADSDVAAAQVALEYLQRAGMHASAAAVRTSVAVATSAQVQEVAIAPELQHCAEWLLGAWAAVEAIKQCAGVGLQATATPHRPWHTETT